MEGESGYFCSHQSVFINDIAWFLGICCACNKQERHKMILVGMAISCMWKGLPELELCISVLRFHDFF